MVRQTKDVDEEGRSALALFLSLNDESDFISCTYPCEEYDELKDWFDNRKKVRFSL